jgi:hypothetical protein
METAFSNPNGHVNEKALDWICAAVKNESGYYSINDSNYNDCIENGINNNDNVLGSNNTDNDNAVINNNKGDVEENGIMSDNILAGSNNDDYMSKNDDIMINNSSNSENGNNNNIDINPCDYDILELYCGNGNHTVAIAGIFICPSSLVHMYLVAYLCIHIHNNICQYRIELISVYIYMHIHN